ncbi:MAG: tRNA threonylcarbamoyladenosine dehydratase [Clostridiales bacterium]|nr:tRNA threonylcarbamoyladenosine dehydratase [Clostridiales bacterium]
MPDAFSRERMLLGEEAVERLQKSHVIVFGLGGVGSFAVEALARAGVGELTLVDHDTVSLTNLNRQLYALHSTMGRWKAEVACDRVRDINPDCRVHVIPEFYLPEHAERFWGARYDYIVDAIDTVSAKIDLACRAQELGIPIIASMGTGNKLDPSRFEVADIYDTQVCPLCRVMRRELKKRDVKKLKVVYSREEPRKPAPCGEETGKRAVPGSISFVPPAAGLLLAGEVIRALSGI